MRFGNASTTVTGTVTPASVNTRVMPHLRPTRPMLIVDPHNAVARGRSALQQGRRFGYSRPQDPRGFTLGYLLTAPATSEIYTLALLDALRTWSGGAGVAALA